MPPLEPKLALLVAVGVAIVAALLLLGPSPERQVLASWYGEEFAGRPTASGEIFDPDEMTVAHKAFPFGACLIVSNPLNGKRVQVRVNDRGPFVGDRELDLSSGAAKAIGLRGVQTVTMKHCRG
jgi:rare lipoprotein A